MSTQFGPQFPGTISLETRKGRPIPNHQDDPSVPEDRREQWRRAFGRQFPKNEERRGPTGFYNCHGLTFANRRTGIHGESFGGNDVTKIVNGILDDDGLRPMDRRDVKPGDLVIYFEDGEIAHTGIVVRVDQGVPDTSAIRGVWILSKWGPAAEYLHQDFDCPWFAGEDSRQYWSERP